jgi:hypothetical protein
MKAISIIAAALVLSFSLTYADAKRTFTTDDGHAYENAGIIRIEPDGLTVQYDSGVAKLLFVTLPAEVQQEFKFDYKAALRYHDLVKQAQHARMAREARAVELAERKMEPMEEPILSGQTCYVRVSELLPNGVLAYVSPLTVVQVGTRNEGKYVLPVNAEVITTISRHPVFIAGIGKRFEGEAIEKIALFTAGD